MTEVAVVVVICAIGTLALKATGPVLLGGRTTAGEATPSCGSPVPPCSRRSWRPTRSPTAGP